MLPPTRPTSLSTNNQSLLLLLLQLPPLSNPLLLLPTPKPDPPLSPPLLQQSFPSDLSKVPVLVEVEAAAVEEEVKEEEDPVVLPLWIQNTPSTDPFELGDL